MSSIISVEANIGSGKTTFLNLLERYYPDLFNPILEPLEDLTRSYTEDPKQNILQYFYNDQKRWGLTMQNNCLISRVNKLRRDIKPGVMNISERSPMSDWKVFATMLHQDQTIDELEWHTYLKWKDTLLDIFPFCKPSLIVYLRVDPEVSYGRMQKRSREQESSVPLDYLKRLHQRHEEWLSTTDIPVLTLDASQNFRDEKNIFDDMVNKIKAVFPH